VECYRRWPRARERGEWKARWEVYSKADNIDL
jgi:hypothetical protein